MMVLWHNKCQLTRHTHTLGHIQLFMLMAMREGAHKRNWSQKEIFNDVRSVTEARLAEEDGWFLRWTWLERLGPRAAIPGLRGSFNCTLGTASIERRDLLLASKPSALCHTHDTHDSAAVKSAFLAEGHFIVTCPPIESGRAQQGPENVSITLLAWTTVPHSRTITELSTTSCLKINPPPN